MTCKNCGQSHPDMACGLKPAGAMPAKAVNTARIPKNEGPPTTKGVDQGKKIGWKK